jgi:cyclic beta-1,2-glucan synthetase
MRFEFLYDRRRRIFSIGYRLPDAEGPGVSIARSTICSRQKRASRALSRSPRATCRSIIGSISDGWSPTFMAGRRWCLGRHAVRVPDAAAADAQLYRDAADSKLSRERPAPVEYAQERGVPWGISESAYSLTDRAGNYQYRAFGVPGLG